MREDVQERLTIAVESIAKSLSKIADKPVVQGTTGDADGPGSLTGVRISSRGTERGWTKYTIGNKEYSTKLQRVINEADAAMEANSLCTIEFEISKNGRFKNYWLNSVTMLDESGNPIDKTDEEKAEDESVF